MKILHNFTEKTLLSIFTFCFAFVLVYVPQDFNKVAEVKAGGSIGGSTEITQILNNIELLGVNLSTTAMVPTNLVTSIQTTGSFLLDNVIDGMAWALAKNIISQMTTSMINWVNSGFQGSPAFITDFKGFVLDIADKQFGQYLEELGGPLSFICAPFKLDVRLALAVTYDYQRVNGQAPGKSDSCTLSGAIGNVDKFIEGTTNFVENGGWDSFFAVTTNPNALTPIGGILSAQAEMSARITNARGEEIKLLDFGSGFLSSKLCTAVEGAGASRQDCTITTPGKVINEALTFQTSAGPRSLIEADEFNEFIGAVFAQVTQQALTGAAGLLGLSGGTGYVYNGQAYMDQLSQETTMDPTNLKSLIEEAIQIEQEYRSLINTYKPQFELFVADPNNSTDPRYNDALDIIDEMSIAMAEIDLMIDPTGYLTVLLNRLNVMMSGAVSPTEMQNITDEYMNSGRHSDQEVGGKESQWENFFR